VSNLAGLGRARQPEMMIRNIEYSYRHLHCKARWQIVRSPVAMPHCVVWINSVTPCHMPPSDHAAVLKAAFEVFYHLLSVSDSVKGGSSKSRRVAVDGQDGRKMCDMRLV